MVDLLEYILKVAGIVPFLFVCNLLFLGWVWKQYLQHLAAERKVRQRLYSILENRLSMHKDTLAAIAEAEDDG